MTRCAFSMLLVSILAGCTHARCAPGEVPNDTLQACVPAPRCDGGMVNDRNECVMSQAEQADSGAHTQGASAAGPTGARSTTPTDPTVEWMCMKNGAGDCTACKQDADCPKDVCEHGYCMDCRNPSQCDAANSCISNRCVPERKPSNLWTTSGGGQISTIGFKLQMSVGAPAPAADAVAPGFRLSVAPGAGSF
jgi:hypothetical protein